MAGLLAAVGVGVLLGFSLTVPPGPMNALIAARSVRSFRAGFLTGLGAMSADAVLGALVYFLASSLHLGSYDRVLYAVGAGVMVLFGALTLAPHHPAQAPPASEVRTYSTALAVGLSNPFQILWWLTAGLAFAYLGGLPLLLGLFGAIAVWIVVFPWALREGAKREPRLERAVTYASGAIMLALAAYFAWLALST